VADIDCFPIRTTHGIAILLVLSETSANCPCLSEHIA
jgi:hypothetical protein